MTTAALVVGCGGSQPSPVAVAPEPPVQQQPLSTPEVPAQSWVGTWESASCGARRYVRRITLQEDGTFEATDLVAPCPAGTRCIWSGIVVWSGRWEREGNRLELKASSDAGPWPESAPEELLLEGDPVVVVEGGGEGCQYTRKADK